MIIKKISIITILIVMSITVINRDYVYSKPINFNISAEGAVLIDVDSGRILYEKNPDKKMRVASLTKIMTAIVAIEYGDLNSYVTTSDNAYGVEGSSIYLQRGEKLTLEDMLYGLMLRSGNDAAVAISEHIGGSVEGFAYLMNNKALFLGMNNTNFSNPHGLDNENHYSTPRDMAILTAYSLKSPTFKEIVSTKYKTAPLEGEEWNRKWVNKNKMLYLYEWADGVKTGYTKLAKRCLASSATKNGVQIACITLNASDDWNDHKKLLEYAFNTFEHTILIAKGDYVKDITIEGEKYVLIADSDFVYPLNSEEIKLVNKNILIDKDIKKINYVTEYGRMEFYFDNKYIGSVSLKVKEKNN